MLKSFDFSALYTDFYELTMAQGYFLTNKKEDIATFDYFFRSNPFNGGYTVFAGLGDFLNLIKDFRFTDENLIYLEKQGFLKDFISYLKDFKFRGEILSCREGEIVFPNEPLIRVSGNIIECQLIETLILNIINFQSLIATKTSRIVYAAEGKPVIDFGLRRAQGFAGIMATKASIIGGAAATSNTLAGYLYDIPVKGTHAHSWVQSFANEYLAFRSFVENFPENAILLIDTYDTLNSGLPNAIKVAKEMERKNLKLKGVRLDSGDFSYFSKKVRERLDQNNLGYVKILVSNQLDEYTIQSLNNQNSPIDMWGVGTRLITAYDQPALDGVYKLSSLNGEAKIKISENIEKINNPGIKKVRRYFDFNSKFFIDGIILEKEENIKVIKHPFDIYKKTPVDKSEYEELLLPVYKDGEIRINFSIKDIVEYKNKRFETLNEEHKRFVNPHVYRVGISKKLWELKDTLIKRYKSNLK